MFNNMKNFQQGLKDAAAVAAANYGVAASNVAKQITTSTGIALKLPANTTAGGSTSAKTGREVHFEVFV